MMSARLWLVILVALPLVGAMRASAQPASPAAAATCAVAPRSTDELMTLWFGSDGTPAEVPDLPPIVTEEADFPAGGPVDAATLGQIRDTAREWTACTNAGDVRRQYALYTDDLATLFSVPLPPDEARAFLESGVPPVPPEFALTISEPLRARQLADGRVGAGFVQASRGLNFNFFIIFEPDSGRWRLDELSIFGAWDPVAPVDGYRVVAAYPHDVEAFTEGLVISEGQLYESTGRNGHQSSLRRVDLATGEILQSEPLADELFGEGIAIVGDRIYQLTLDSGSCFVYDRETFAVVDTFMYETEGWGLTSDGERLIMSDGTSRITFRDPATFAETGFIDVRDDTLPVAMLNELEYIDGEIWANVFRTDRIARIDPATGVVIGWADLAGLLPADVPGAESAEVLNGIATDMATGQIYVTGKLWPRLYEIEMLPRR